MHSPPGHNIYCIVSKEKRVHEHVLGIFPGYSQFDWAVYSNCLPQGIITASSVTKSIRAMSLNSSKRFTNYYQIINYVLINDVVCLNINIS